MDQILLITGGVLVAIMLTVSFVYGFIRLLKDHENRNSGMSRTASDLLSKVVDESDLQNMSRAGPQAMLAEANPYFAGLLKKAAGTNIGTHNSLIAALKLRSKQVGKDLNKALDKTLGVPGTSGSSNMTPHGDMSNQIDALYKRAYAKPIDYASDAGRRIVRDILTRVPESVIKEANELMHLEGYASKQILMNIADDGTMTFRQLPDVMQIDHITRVLNGVDAANGKHAKDGIISEDALEMDPEGILYSSASFTARIIAEDALAMGPEVYAYAANGKRAKYGTTDLGRAYKNLSRDLREALKEAVPEYKNAVNVSDDEFREYEAREFGKELMADKTTADDAREMFDDMDMDKAELRWVRQEVRDKIKHDQGNVAIDFDMVSWQDSWLRWPTVNVEITNWLSKEAVQEKLALVLEPDQMDYLGKHVNRAANFHNMKPHMKPAPGSVFQNLERLRGGSPLNLLRLGRPVDAATKAAATLVGRGDKAKQRINEELARILQSKGPEAQAYLRHLLSL